MAMKIKHIGFSVLLIVVLLCASWIASPYWASYRVHSALKNNDAALLAQYIDFPAVRASLKPQVEQQLEQRLGVKETEGLLGQVQQQGVEWLSHNIVDWIVSPTGILLILQGKAGYESELWQATNRYIQQFSRPLEKTLASLWHSSKQWLKGEDTAQPLETAKQPLPTLAVTANTPQHIPKFQTHYGLQQFQLDVPYENQQVQVQMQRQNNSWSWKITAVYLSQP